MSGVMAAWKAALRCQPYNQELTQGDVIYAQKWALMVMPYIGEEHGGNRGHQIGVRWGSRELIGEEAG